MDAMILLGQPGAGKTTLAEYLTEGLPYEETDSPFAFRRYDCGVLELGKRRPGGFGGTDALAMNVQPKVLAFLEAIRPKLLFFEGDRLSNDSMFRALQDMGAVLSIYELWAPQAQLEAQRRLRVAELGTVPQNATWLAGRATKVRNLRREWKPTTLPSGATMDDLVSRMTDPVSVTLRKARGWVPALTAEQIEEARIAAL
jgi:hypothetical protein